MYSCNVLNASFGAKAKAVTDNGREIDLVDMVVFSAEATADAAVDENQKLIFGFLQRLNRFSAKKVYSTGNRDFQTISIGLSTPVVDKDDVYSKFYHFDSCGTVGSLMANKLSNKRVAAQLKDHPSIMRPVRMEDGGAPLIWLDYYADFTTWLGYEVVTWDPRTRAEARQLVLLQQWNTSLHYSYLRSRVSPHVNIVSSCAESVEPMSATLEAMFNGKPANDIVDATKPTIAKTDAWVQRFAPPQPED
jgi:hypothetical protein